MTSAPIVLYDIPNKQGTSWSLNPWKVRMIMNYKKIEYQTEWIELPDIEPTLRSYGVAPNSREIPGHHKDYTSPAVKFPDGSYQMESWTIAHELEKRYPSPALELDDPIVVQMRDHVFKIIAPLYSHAAPKVVAVLNKPSAEYYYKANKEMIDTTLQEEEKGTTSDYWEAARGPAKEAGDVVRKNGGPFFLGETVSFADFVFVSLLYSLRQLDEDIFQKFLTLDSAFPTMYDASKQWLERND